MCLRSIMPHLDETIYPYAEGHRVERGRIASLTSSVNKNSLSVVALSSGDEPHDEGWGKGEH